MHLIGYRAFVFCFTVIGKFINVILKQQQIMKVIYLEDASYVSPLNLFNLFEILK